MGEYIRVFGETVKVGTCEDLKYYTYLTLREMCGVAERVDGNAFPREYLDKTKGWRYRFPFPHDFEPDNLDYSVPVKVSRALAESLEHRPVWSTIGPKGLWSTCAVNVQTPCPNSSDADPTRFSQGAINKETATLMVSAVGWRAGSWRVIVSCPFCQSAINIGKEEAESIASLNEHNQHMPPAVLLNVYEWDENGNPQ